MSTSTKSDPAVVLGHRGAIGEAITSVLESSGRKVIGISTREGDLRNAEHLGRLLDSLGKPAHVVFCAGVTRTVSDTEETRGENEAIVRSVIDAVERSRPLSFVFVSTSDVYGPNPRSPISEQSDLNPITPYARGKEASERLIVERLSALLPTCRMRIPGTFGAGVRDRSAIGRWLSQLQTGTTVTVTASPELLRDYVPTPFVARVVARLLDEPHEGILNVATGHSWPLRRWIESLRTMIGSEAQIEWLPAPRNAIGDLQFDVAKLCNLFADVIPPTPDEALLRYLDERKRVS